MNGCPFRRATTRQAKGNDMVVKVLILEDNPAAREFLGRVVRESFSDTITIVEAGDLETARRAVRIAGGAQGYHGVDPFKLVLVDLELPDGSGLELLEELRQYPATKIVTTLSSDEDPLFPALQSGADGYLLKEARFELLVEELQKIVRGEPPLSPAIPRRRWRSSPRSTCRPSRRARWRCSRSSARASPSRRSRR